MQIAFRTDASLQIGTGHVMRCLTLADSLRKRGATCIFVCRAHTGHLLQLIEQRGHATVALPAGEDTYQAPADPTHAAWLGAHWSADAEQTRQALGNALVDWLVVDHYALDRRWEQTLRPHCRKLMVIDDLADRPHDADLLLDQNLGRASNDYDGLLAPHTQTLIGPRYALLRPEFAQWRAYSLERREQAQLRNLLITMGGVDKDNATGQVLQALQSCELPEDLRITVVMGPHAPWLGQVQTLAARMQWPTQVLVGVSNMAQLMANSDLAIGAAGSTSWERCCLGLPAIQLVLALNQQSINAALNDVGAVTSVIAERLQTGLKQFLSQKKILEELDDMSCAARAVCNGQGAIQIAELISKARHEDHFTLQ
jgi:UDP-2,4-diacetamido-2,4,6-trideoxy-beta-L-altropyranose hydrolase